MTIQRPAAGRWGAYTTPAAAGRADSWQRCCRSRRTEYSGTPGPRRHTRDIPTCPASTSRAHCKGASTRYYAHTAAPAEEQAAPDRPAATAQQHNDRTAYSTASPPTPAAARHASPRPYQLAAKPHNTHLPPPCVNQKSHQNPRTPRFLLAAENRLQGGREGRPHPLPRVL